MNKKLLAAAVAGALAAPGVAFAQASSVTISGRLNATFENIKATGATLGSANDFTARNRLTDNASEIRFAGRENLGGGLNAWFTIGTGLEISFAGIADPFGRGLFASRNSGAGLDSEDWGSIMLGKWDVHYDAGYVPSLGHTDFGYIDQGQATFSSLVIGTGQVGVGFQGGRLSNTVRYVSPTWNGFQLIAAYARNDEDTYADNGVAATNGGNKPRQRQFAPHYRNGPFGAFYSYFSDKNSAAGATAANPGALLGTVTAGTPTALGVGIASGLRDIRGDRAGASWNFPMGLKVGLVYDRIRSDIYGGVLSGAVGSFSSSLERNAWSLPISYVTGPHKFNFVYARADSLTGSRGSSNAAITGYDASDTGAGYFTLGYRYALSKRSSVYADYAKISNKGRAGYDFFAYAGINNGILPAASIGADLQTIQLGIYHTF